MKQPKDYIVFPLDVDTVKQAKKYINLLSEHVGMFKVGLELFIKSGPEIIDFIKQTGTARIFLDLKLHDIPVTVMRAMERIADFGVDYATVHCGESKKMLEYAVRGSKNKVGVLVVTVLTSVSGNDLKKAGFKKEFSDDISKLVIKRAEMAMNTGCRGIVCSGKEVNIIKNKLGTKLVTVTPGIRPDWKNSSEDDQFRVTTPAQAIRNGADYLVIGRPIRDAIDPVKAAVQIAGEIKNELTKISIF